MKRPGIQSIEKIKLSSPNSMNNKYMLFIPKDYNSQAKESPLILFLHGAKDNDVPIHKSEEMVEALKACGAILYLRFAQTQHTIHGRKLITILSFTNGSFSIKKDR